MNVSPDVNFEELARSTDDFNAAQLKAVCVEAGMLALRRDATEVRTVWLAHCVTCLTVCARVSSMHPRCSGFCKTARGYSGVWQRAGQCYARPVRLKMHMFLHARQEPVARLACGKKHAVRR